MSELHDNTPTETGWYWILYFGDRWFLAFLDRRKTPIGLRILANNTDRRFDGQFHLDDNRQWIREDGRSAEDPAVWSGPLQHPERL